MFEALDHITHVGLTTSDAEKLALGLTAEEQQTLVSTMTTGTLIGMTLGGAAGFYGRNIAEEKLGGPGALAAAGAIVWLGGRLFPPLGRKTVTVDGIRNITTADVVLSSAPGALGLMWLGIGLFDYLRRTIA
ncbi:MAG: hypothetical protein ACYCPT_01985 [Acidimicrobiales bacterium]